MAKSTIHIPSDGGTDFVIDKSNRSYILDDGRILSSATIETDPVDNIDNIVLTIDGLMTGDSIAIDIGAANSSGNKIIIGKSGLVDATMHAISTEGQNTRIANLGTIFGSDPDNSVGIESMGDGARISNSGFLKAATGFEITGNDNLIVNSGVMTGHSGMIGIEFFSQTGEFNRFTNTGIMQGGEAVRGGDGAEKITNRGDMHGSVKLGAGDDVLVTSRNIGGDIRMDDGNDRVTLKGKGAFTSLEGGTGEDVFDLRAGDELSLAVTIGGGMDDDTIIVSRNDLFLKEIAGGGTDTVKSTVSFTLGNEFEDLVLIGTKAVDGTGNILANHITGNDKHNTLNGMAGMDELNGGRGNDVLTGGADADLFVFLAKAGRDVITDFTDGADKIDLKDYKGIGSFDDLEGRIDQDGADTVITLKNGDKITLDNFDAGNLTMIDFQF